MRVLIVEDEPGIAQFIAQDLKEAGYAKYTPPTGRVRAVNISAKYFGSEVQIAVIREVVDWDWRSLMKLCACIMDG
jgi:DNA-binding response OmpR family regulator